MHKYQGSETTSLAPVTFHKQQQQLKILMVYHLEQ
jgi:hypothetical protein